MIEEIISEEKPHSRLRVLEADQKIIGGLPGVDGKISFLPFVNYLKEKRPAVSHTKSNFYNYLIKKLEDDPELLSPVEDIELLQSHADILELLSTALFPVVSEHEKNSFALAAPYQFRIFYYSDCFTKLFVDNREEHLLLPSGMPREQIRAIQCSMIYDQILEKYYGIKLNDSPELVYLVADAETGMKRYYRMHYDRRFIDVRLKGILPPIQDCAVCLNTFRILDLEHQLKKMPLELFEVEGFAVWVAEDVTTSESLETIKKILLRQDECDAAVINELKKTVQALVGLSGVEVGLMPFVKINNSYVFDEENSRHSQAGKHWQANDPEHLADFRKFMEFMKTNPEPMPVTHLSPEMLGFAPHLRQLYESGARSYIYCPLQNSDGLLGLLELASPVPNLTHEVLSRLEPAVPLLSVVLLKNRNSFEHRIEKLIKEKFTMLQPSVEWKCSELAWEYMKKNRDGLTETRDLIFENVYPLYGAIDIRNSSTERSHAIQKDLNEHLHLINDTLDKLQLHVQLPILEGLQFKNRNLQQAIESGLLSEDEMRINEFLENEVEPVFCHLEKSNKQAQAIVEDYFAVVKNCDALLCHFRNEYEETLTSINNTVFGYLEKQEDILQKSYPHYFEKYTTDGVEYNIYIGQSMAPDVPFDALYLKNIRLWQLKSMAEVARITHQLSPSLKVNLQTTQLILIHSKPLSISFRNDERRFDVVGSYNVRFEIMKKRLDKVRIRDTQERLTQVGKIAVVYSNPKEAQEYQEYIEFVQSKSLLKPGVEFLELEELQGIKGLKALRVDVNLDVL